MVHLKKVTLTNRLIFCQSCILGNLMMKGDRTRLNKDLWYSTSWLTECVWAYVCETIHRAFHVNTGVWVSLSWNTGLVLCSADVWNQKLCTFLQCHNWPQPWPKQTHAKSRSKFFCRDPCSAPRKAHRSFACIGHNIGHNNFLPKCTWSYLCLALRSCNSSKGWWSCQPCQLVVKGLWGWEMLFMNMVSHAICQRSRRARTAYQMNSVCERSVRCCQDLPCRPSKLSMPTQNGWKQKKVLPNRPLQGAHKGSGDVAQWIDGVQPYALQWSSWWGWLRFERCQRTMRPRNKMFWNTRGSGCHQRLSQRLMQTRRYTAVPIQEPSSFLIFPSRLCRHWVSSGLCSSTDGIGDSTSVVGRSCTICHSVAEDFRSHREGHWSLRRKEEKV